VLAENRFFRRVGEQEEVALLPQADVLPEPFVEAFPDADAVGGEADVRLGRELLPDPARGVGGRATADRVLLQNDDVGQTALCQRVRDRAAHDSGTDDDGVCRGPHVLPPSYRSGAPRRRKISETRRRKPGSTGSPSSSSSSVSSCSEPSA